MNPDELDSARSGPPGAVHWVIVRRVIAGDTDVSIACGEHVSERTVRRRIREVMDYLGVKSRIALAAEVVRRDLV